MPNHEGTPTRRKNKRFTLSQVEEDPIEIPGPAVNLISRPANEVGSFRTKLLQSDVNLLSAKLDHLELKSAQRHRDMLDKFEQIRVLLVSERA
jgi:hypothetical protein